MALGRNELRQGQPGGAADRLPGRGPGRLPAGRHPGREAGLEADALIPLAEATFTYIEELFAASIEGYAAEQAGRAGELDRHRHALLALLLADTADAAAVAEATAAARWAVPDTIAAVLVDPQCAEGLSRNLGPEALVAAHHGAVVALVPAPAPAVLTPSNVTSVAGVAASRSLLARTNATSWATRISRDRFNGGDPLGVVSPCPTRACPSDPSV